MTLKAWCERSILIAALALGGAAGAFAQVTTGSVAGTVKDAQGGVIPGATVTLISESQGTARRPSSPTRPATSCSSTSRPTPTPSRSRCPRSRR